MDYTIPTFTFAGHEIDVVISELPQTTEFDLENFVSGARQAGRNAAGTVKLILVQRGVASIKVDGKNRPLWHKDKDGDQVFRIPNLRDPDTRKGLNEELIRLIVEKNDFLAFVEPFSQIFASYLPEDEQETENPTEETDSSGATSTPGSGGETQPPASPPS